MQLESDTEDIDISLQKKLIAAKPNAMHRLTQIATQKCARVAEPDRGGLFINTSRMKTHLRLNAALKRKAHNGVWMNFKPLQRREASSVVQQQPV